jgi:3-oxoacyl-[acyl-carrier protein] reductase
MDLGISGKRALVLGGNRGIGFGIARELAREGVSVCVAARDPAKLEEACGLLRQAGSGQMQGIPVDLENVDGLPAFAEKVTSEFGPIDILVNNTGGPGYGGVSQRGFAEWRGHFEDMVLSVITLTDAFVPGMRARKWGRVLTVISSGVTQPIPILGVSNTLRGALVGWNKTLSGEVAKDGVTCNVLVPGRIDTERVRKTDEAVAAKEGISVDEAKARSTAIIPLGRYGSIEEFGSLAAFTASVRASYITGSTLRCDGGIIRSI